MIRSQIEMPIDDSIMLNKGDVLQVSGDARQVKSVAEKIGFISIHGQVTDLLAFAAFFISACVHWRSPFSSVTSRSASATPPA